MPKKKEINRFLKIASLAKSHEEQMKKEGRAEIQRALKDFFANHPEVVWLEWDQYTPHFNDGEACVFAFQELHVLLKDQKEPCVSWDSDTFPNRSLHSAVVKLEEQLKDIEGALRTVFGDHARVRVYPSGKVQIISNESEHE